MIQVKLDDLPNVLRKDVAKRRGAALKALRVTVKARGLALAQEVIAETQPPPVDRGMYRRSFKTSDLPDGVALFNVSLYAGVIEEGRRPGSRMPPLQVIADWLYRKGAVGRPRGKQGRLDALANARRLAWPVARAIARRGIPAKNVMLRVYQKLLPVVIDAVNEAVAKPPETL